MKLLGLLLDFLVEKRNQYLIHTDPLCEVCEGKTERQLPPRLYLLPVYHDHTYQASKEYFLRSCMPIPDIRYIPTGQRACRMWILNCTQCTERYVLIQDFLQVRDSEVVEGQYMYPYRDFALLFSEACGV